MNDFYPPEDILLIWKLLSYMLSLQLSCNHYFKDISEIISVHFAQSEVIGWSQKGLKVSELMLKSLKLNISSPVYLPLWIANSNWSEEKKNQKKSCNSLYLLYSFL